MERPQEVQFLGNNAQGEPQFQVVPAERRQLREDFQVGLKGKAALASPQGDFIEGPDGDMIPVPRGIDKERGNFVLVPDGQGGRKRMWRERGQLFDSPDAAANLAARSEDMASGIFRPQVAPAPRGQGRASTSRSCSGSK